MPPDVVRSGSRQGITVPEEHQPGHCRLSVDHVFSDGLL